MLRIHQNGQFRRDAMRELWLRLCVVIGVVLAIGIWTSQEASAVTANPAGLTFQAVKGKQSAESDRLPIKIRLSSAHLDRDRIQGVDHDISRFSGTITNDLKFSVAVNIAGLAAGTYTATVTVRLDNGEGHLFP
ncbi:MAG: hypothetical protein QM771_16805 [Nitrospira sp.]